MLSEKVISRGYQTVVPEKIKEHLLIFHLIISESITKVGSLEGGKVGKVLYEYILDNCKIEFINEGMMNKSMETFLKYDGSISLADASIIEKVNIT